MQALRCQPALRDARSNAALQAQQLQQRSALPQLCSRRGRAQRAHTRVRDKRAAALRCAALPPAAVSSLRSAAAGAALLASLALAQPAGAASRPPPPPPPALSVTSPTRTARDAAAFARAAAVLLTATAAAVLLARARARAREPRPRVVIVGAGFAGLQAALELQHWAHVSVVDRASYFEYTPGVLRAMADGNAAPCHRPHSASLARSALVRVPSEVQLHVGDGELRMETPKMTTTLPFDFLVLATGSSYPAPIKPGGSEQVRMDVCSCMLRGQPCKAGS
jgi:hypothetical protein